MTRKETNRILVLWSILFFLWPHISQASLLDDINAYRESHALPQVIYNEYLCSIANGRYYQILADWSHNRLHEYLLGHAVMPGVYSENLARNFTSDESVLAAWQRSPTHDRILLDKDMVEMCVRSIGSYYLLEGYAPLK